MAIKALRSEHAAALRERARELREALACSCEGYCSGIGRAAQCSAPSRRLRQVEHEHETSGRRLERECAVRVQMATEKFSFLITITGH